MGRTTRGVAIEIACLGGLLAVAWLAGRLVAGPTSVVVTGGSFVLEDGTTVEAATSEDVDEVQRLYRGRVKSASLKMDNPQLPLRIIVTTLVALVGVAALVALRNRARLAPWFAASWRHVALGCGGGLALAAMGWLMSEGMDALGLTPEILKIWSLLKARYPAWLFLLGVVVAPTAEELYFRGRLFEALERRGGQWGAVGLTSGLFAVCHAIPVLIPGYLLYGVVLAGLRIRSGGLLAPILAHAINNAIALSLTD